jgi:hypothetical protein
MSLPKFQIPAEKHQIKLLNDALKLLKKNHEIYRKRKYNLLSIFSYLETKTAYYEGKIYHRFFDFIDKAIKNTTPGFFSGPKVATRADLRNILLNIILAVKSIRKEMSHDLKDFINHQFGYKISNESETLNLFNFLLNYEAYDNFDTVKLIKQVNAELMEEVDTTPIEKMKISLKGGKRSTRKVVRRKTQTRSNRKH